MYTIMKPQVKTYWQTNDNTKRGVMKISKCNTCQTTVQVNSCIYVKHDKILYRNNRGNVLEKNQCRRCIKKGKQLEYKQM